MLLPATRLLKFLKAYFDRTFKVQGTALAIFGHCLQTLADYHPIRHSLQDGFVGFVTYYSCITRQHKLATTLLWFYSGFQLSTTQRWVSGQPLAVSDQLFAHRTVA